MGKPIVEVTRRSGMGGVDVSLEGSTIEVLSAMSVIALSFMSDVCRHGGFPEKEAAEALIHAVKLGIEGYLEECHGGKGGADYGEV